MPEFTALVALSKELQKRRSLDDLLQHIVEKAALMLSTQQVSLRLLDPGHTQLMAVCRHGEPLHINPTQEFQLGEGLLGWIAQVAEPILTGAPEQDPRFQFRPDMKGPMGSFLGVPLISPEGCIGVLSAVHPEKDFFTERHLEIFTLIAALSAPYIEISRLQRLSQVDPLTGALNRRGFEMFLPEDPAFSVLMVDIDHFKVVNDNYGHALGDEVLKRVAHLLSSSLRSGDAIVRYGGEEFLVILAEVDLSRAAKIGERARQAIAEKPIAAGGKQISITISIGVAERRGDEERDSLIERADTALYQAKQAGRNKVVVAE